MGKELAVAASALAELPPMPVGEELATAVIDGLEADLSLAIRRRSLASAQARLRIMTSDFRRMVNELNADYSHTEEGLVRMYVMGTRDELFKCYMAVQPALARTTDGRQHLAELVDGVIASSLDAIRKPATTTVEEVEPAEKKRPTRGRAASA